MAKRPQPHSHNSYAAQFAREAGLIPDRRTRAIERLADELRHQRLATTFDRRKLEAAQAALAAVKKEGKTPSFRNIELKSEKLGNKVTRATVRKYHGAGLLVF